MKCLIPKSREDDNWGARERERERATKSEKISVGLQTELSASFKEMQKICMEIDGSFIQESRTCEDPTEALDSMADASSLGYMGCLAMHMKIRRTCSLRGYERPFQLRELTKNGDGGNRD